MAVPLEIVRTTVDPMRGSTSFAPRPTTGVSSAPTNRWKVGGELLRLVREEAIDAVNIKPMKSGVLESIAIWHVARAAGIEMMIGGMLESVLAMSFSANLAPASGGFSYVDLDRPCFMTEHPFAGGSEQTGARLSVANIEWATEYGCGKRETGTAGALACQLSLPTHSYFMGGDAPRTFSPGAQKKRRDQVRQY